MIGILETDQVAPEVLDYFAEKRNLPDQFYSAVITNPKTPDIAIVKFARHTQNGALLELITFNQQRLIRLPAIIDAILNNSFRTIEADRRAAETKREFFEKERGAQQVANELRAQGKSAAAEFIESAEFVEDLDKPSSLTLDDALLLAKHIEVPIRISMIHGCRSNTLKSFTRRHRKSARRSLTRSSASLRLRKTM